MEDQNPLHYLNGKWDLYYHLPTDNNWTLSSYKTLMKDIDSVEKVIRLNEAIPDNSIKNSMLFLMRSQVTPLWEDPKNRGGGCFSFKVLNKQVYEIWKALFYALCGETLCSNHSHFELINGIIL